MEGKKREEDVFDIPPNKSFNIGDQVLDDIYANMHLIHLFQEPETTIYNQQQINYSKQLLWYVKFLSELRKCHPHPKKPKEKKHRACLQRSNWPSLFPTRFLTTLTTVISKNFSKILKYNLKRKRRKRKV